MRDFSLGLDSAMRSVMAARELLSMVQVFARVATSRSWTVFGAVADRDNHVEIVIFDVASYASCSFFLNCCKFRNS